jgi:hypothetical protein
MSSARGSLAGHRRFADYGATIAIEAATLLGGGLVVIATDGGAVAFAISGLLTLPLERILPKALDRGSSGGPRSESSSSRAASADVSFRSLWSENQLFRLLFVGAAASGLLGPMLYFQFQFVKLFANFFFLFRME